MIGVWILLHSTDVSPRGVSKGIRSYDRRVRTRREHDLRYSLSETDEAREIQPRYIKFPGIKLSKIESYLEEICISSTFTYPTYGTFNFGSDSESECFDRVSNCVSEIIVGMNRPGDWCIGVFLGNDGYMLGHKMEKILLSLHGMSSTDRIRTVDVCCTVLESGSHKISSEVKI